MDQSQATRRIVRRRRWEPSVLDDEDERQRPDGQQTDGTGHPTAASQKQPPCDHHQKDGGEQGWEVEAEGRQPEPVPEQLSDEPNREQAGGEYHYDDRCRDRKSVVEGQRDSQG